MNWTYVGSEKITSTATSSAVYTLTPPSSLGFIQRAVVEVAEGGTGSEVYYTFDGTAPSSANGKRLYFIALGGSHRYNLELNLHQISRLKLSGSTAAIGFNVNYYG